MTTAETCAMRYDDFMAYLPPELLSDGVTTVEKLVYLWIKQNPGKHSARSLDTDLGVRTHNALGELVRRGLLLVESLPAARRPGIYRAAPLLRGPRQSGGKDQQHGD